MQGRIADVVVNAAVFAFLCWTLHSGQTNTHNSLTRLKKRKENGEMENEIYKTSKQIHTLRKGRKPTWVDSTREMMARRAVANGE